MKWDPSKYVQFADHRDRPFYELTARITAAAPRLVVDLGCGPGPLAHSLAERWPDARVIGLDSSQEMIEQARSTQQSPNLSFQSADATQWMPEADTDVLVSNAMLQWIPEHRELLATWLEALTPGAWFAAQVPGNFGSPSHALMRQLAASARWAPQLAGVLRHDDAVGEPADYLKIMVDAGFEPDVWETTYGQVLTGEHPVLEWVRGTALRPILSKLSAADAVEFEEEYSGLVAQAYPAFADARGERQTLFPFRRIFMVGRKR
ncbi:trans-aconitate 2-methyltransferase [Paeniglutamicibacter gangotriensis]|uniref:Trans-aconitate 2-methyltransferase n=1 Tax=Paeniglutamicibacter gangotriensis TaxID=254787 RepID=A0A5B0EM07_9MICC|nr:trans-aconitate 2-methyltransferase [Paeniglutamicibacter gangotriensis]KAA0979843.1 trans-aconitate 2-methyltransferase [Paeniglutamicibacter gangotriensis]